MSLRVQNFQDLTQSRLTDPFGKLGGRGKGARRDVLVLEVVDEDAAAVLAVVRGLRFLRSVVALDVGVEGVEARQPRLVAERPQVLRKEALLKRTVRSFIRS